MTAGPIHRPTDLTAPGAIEELLAFHRATFGDARMEAEGEGQEGDQPDDQETPPEGAGEGDEGSNSDEPAEGDDESSSDPDPKDDELPEWARTKLTKANAEAANYRTRLREVEKKLNDAKSPEEVEAAIADLREQNAKLERAVLTSKVARKYDLPDTLAERLKGATQAELEADAKELQKLLGGAQEPEHLSGGLDPTDHDDGETDPGVLARKYGRRRR